MSFSSDIIYHEVLKTTKKENRTMSSIVESAITLAFLGLKSTFRPKSNSNLMTLISTLVELEDPNLSLIIDLLEVHRDSLKIDNRIIQ